MVAIGVVVLVCVVASPSLSQAAGLYSDCISRENCFWINEMKQRQPVNYVLNKYGTGHYYCYHGYSEYTVPGLLRLWHNLAVKVTAKPPDGLIVTLGNSSKAAQSKEAQVHTSYTNQTRTMYLASFGVSCVGLKSSGSTDVSYTLSTQEVFMWRYPVLLLTGIILLYLAPLLCRNVYLYYGTGISLGILGSILILLYIMSKFIPKKNLLGLGFLFGGYAATASLFYWLTAYAQDLLINHWHYVLAYICIAGLISFAVMYWYGPASTRSLDLIQWGVQLVALALVFCSIPIPEVSGVMVAMVILFYCVPVRCNPFFLLLSVVYHLLACLLSPLSFLNPLRLFQRRPVITLLTMEGYEEQGRVETAKALTELREHCRKGEMWGTISRLQDPKKFTAFLAGRGHVNAEEMVDHEWSFVLDDSSGSDSDTVEYREEPVDSSPSPPHRSSSFEYSRGSHSPPSPSHSSPRVRLRGAYSPRASTSHHHRRN